MGEKVFHINGNINVKKRFLMKKNKNEGIFTISNLFTIHASENFGHE